MWAAQNLPGVEQLPVPLAMGMVVLSMVVSAYALIRQIRSSRLSELDVVVDRVSKENTRMDERLSQLQQENEGLRVSLAAMQSDMEQCMQAREADHRELVSLRRQLEDDW